MRALAIVLLSLLAANPALAKPPKTKVIAPKVLVMAMIPPEAKPWLDNEKPTVSVAVPGLPLPVKCTPTGTCIMVTGMGYANAASSASAVIYSRTFDLRKTYILIAGIAGVDPADGTLGSAHWARYAVDLALRHEIDPRQIPLTWSTGFIALGAHRPGEQPVWQADTEVYQLDEALLQKAYTLSKATPLADTPAAQALRTHYTDTAATSAPFVSICDTLSSDLYWYGSMMEKQVADMTAILTKGKANGCTTQMEDNATLTALKRGQDAGLLDFKRVAVLRTASDFDREGKDQTVAETLGDLTGFGIATENAYRAGSALTHDIVARWPKWQAGVPKD